MQIIDWNDRITPRPLTLQELWSSWCHVPLWQRISHEEVAKTLQPLHEPQAIKERLEKYGCGCWRCANLGGPFASCTVYPEIRSIYALEGPYFRFAAHLARIDKMTIIRQLFQIHENEFSNARLDEIWIAFRHEPQASHSVEFKLERADAFKAAGNEYLRLEDWRGAMISYVRAWSWLLPYHYLAFDTSDPRYMALGKFECALFANVGALAILAVQAQELDQDIKSCLTPVGMTAVLCGLGMHAFASVGLMRKLYLRAYHLWAYLEHYGLSVQYSNTQVIDRSLAQAWKEQAEKLQTQNFHPDMKYADVGVDLYMAAEAITICCK